MSFRDKMVRKACWESRDRYWSCLDGVQNPQIQCSELKKLYESACPQQWVKHFQRKRDYLKFKERIHSFTDESENCSSIQTGDNGQPPGLQTPILSSWYG